MSVPTLDPEHGVFSFLIGRRVQFSIFELVEQSAVFCFMDCYAGM